MLVSSTAGNPSPRGREALNRRKDVYGGPSTNFGRLVKRHDTDRIVSTVVSVEGKLLVAAQAETLHNPNTDEEYARAAPALSSDVAPSPHRDLRKGDSKLVRSWLAAGDAPRSKTRRWPRGNFFGTAPR